MTVADRLREADLDMVGRFANASNATLLVRLLDRDPTPTPDDATVEELDPDDLAVYKPRRGERPLWDFAQGTLHLREVAAHRLSEVLGWDLVPTTVLRRDAPLGPGSLQRFVRHDPDEHYFSLDQRGADDGSAIRHQLERMVLFDAVTSNADRKGGHVMIEHVGGESHVRLVDHGVTFHVEDKLRTVAWDFAGDRVDASDRATLRDAHERLVLDAAPLEGLLSHAELDALLARLAEVAEWEVFPAPEHDRRYPWPLL